MSLEISEQITSATSVIRNHIIKHNRKNRDDKIDYITIEPERVSVFYVKSEYQAQHTDAPNNNEALLKLHRMYNDMNSKVEQIHSRITQVDAVNHIIQYTKEMVKVMKEPSHNKLIRHPNFAEDDFKQVIA
ncbi:9886_t:CDS:2 [Paraglomus brasilianum]|uniref:9886_t:CDS:1 n=1 Tax=Paraglomus brasilianum TaxID=144538 RepID=A0A9N8WBP5_9GLOM|nr:9886_t:CDS:2 [Paraglomus brasilianum]